MIYGIGTDIVRVSRMQNDLERFGDKLARRILTEHELADFNSSNSQAHFLAKRFAAKEATAKAMGIGFSHGLFLNHIGVLHDEYGKPVLEFYGRAAELREELGIGDSHVSLADEEDVAVAFVTLLSV